MAYRPNPFLLRGADTTVSDADFIGLFSPRLLERLPDTAFKGGVHLFHSPPGAGKTTLLRAFTPGALRGFWSARRSDEMGETLEELRGLSILDESGPQLLGVMLSCAAGYADLPPGIEFRTQGLFRALFDCRTVFQALKGLGDFLGQDYREVLQEVTLEYGSIAQELKYIPLTASAVNLLEWAQNSERQIYSELDGLGSNSGRDIATHIRFESVLWFQGVKFFRNGVEFARNRLLMVDDLHKLREAQRTFMLDELTVLRPSIPLWLAQRSISFGPSLLSQGARMGRDLNVYSLDDLWSSGKAINQFTAFIENILDRRLAHQVAIHSHSFRSLVRGDITNDEIKAQVQDGLKSVSEFLSRFQNDVQYSKWLQETSALASEPSYAALLELLKIRIYIARNERKRQPRLDLEPLSVEDLEERDAAKDSNAAEIFANREFRIPYYWGLDRVAVMATYNVQEALGLAASLYEALRAKRVMRFRELSLTPQEQDRVLREAARLKLESVPSTHSEGTRARRLLESIGEFCVQRTFEINAPYAPGVTGVSIADTELERLNQAPTSDARLLVGIIAECVAENLLVRRQVSATTGRPASSVFYLNRTLCACFGLPLQHGGWQDVPTARWFEWLNRGAQVKSSKRSLA